MRNINLFFTAAALLIMMGSCATSSVTTYYPDNVVMHKGMGQDVATNSIVSENTSESRDAAIDQSIEAAVNTTIEETSVVSQERVVEIMHDFAKEAQGNLAEIEKLKQQEYTGFGSRILKRMFANMGPTNPAEMMAYKQGVKKKSFGQKLTEKIMMRSMKKKLQKLAPNNSTADILAIVAISSAGAAFVTWYAGFIFVLAAIGLGIAALVMGTSRRGMAIAAIAIGVLALLWVPLLFFIII